jgi:hypothetical protein
MSEPGAYVVAVEEGIAVLTWCGAATPALFAEACADIVHLADYVHGMPLLVVDPGTQFAPSGDDLWQYARMLAETRPAFCAYALVVTRMLHRSVGQLIADRAILWGVVVLVCTSRLEAEAWLRTALRLRTRPARETQAGARAAEGRPQQSYGHVPRLRLALELPAPWNGDCNGCMNAQGLLRARYSESTGRVRGTRSQADAASVFSGMGRVRIERGARLRLEQ